MLEIRLAKQSDIKQIQDIADESWHDTYQDLMPQQIIESCLNVFYRSDRLEKRVTNNSFFVAAVDQRIVGFLDGSLEPEATLYALYVLPTNISQGIGKALLQKYLGHPMIKTITVDVEKGNERARHFYQTFGFQHDRHFVDVVFDYPLQTEQLKLVR